MTAWRVLSPSAQQIVYPASGAHLCRRGIPISLERHSFGPVSPDSGRKRLRYQRSHAGCVVKTDKRPTSTMCSVVFPRSDPHRPLQYSLNGLGLAVREILGEVGFGELMQRGAKGGVFHLETAGPGRHPRNVKHRRPSTSCNDGEVGKNG